LSANVWTIEFSVLLDNPCWKPIRAIAISLQLQLPLLCWISEVIVFYTFFPNDTNKNIIWAAHDIFKNNKNKITLSWWWDGVTSWVYSFFLKHNIYMYQYRHIYFWNEFGVNTFQTKSFIISDKLINSKRILTTQHYGIMII